MGNTPESEDEEDRPEDDEEDEEDDEGEYEEAPVPWSEAVRDLGTSKKTLDAVTGWVDRISRAIEKRAEAEGTLAADRLRRQDRFYLIALIVRTVLSCFVLWVVYDLFVRGKLTSESALPLLGAAVASLFFQPRRPTGNGGG